MLREPRGQCGSEVPYQRYLPTTVVILWNLIVLLSVCCVGLCYYQCVYVDCVITTNISGGNKWLLRVSKIWGLPHLSLDQGNIYLNIYLEYYQLINSMKYNIEEYCSSKKEKKFKIPEFNLITINLTTTASKR